MKEIYAAATDRENINLDQIGADLEDISAVLSLATSGMEGETESIGDANSDRAPGLAVYFVDRLETVYIPAIRAAQNMVCSLAEQVSNFTEED